MNTAMIEINTVTAPTKTGLATSAAVPRRLVMAPKGSRGTVEPSADRSHPAAAERAEATAACPSRRAPSDRADGGRSAAGQTVAWRCRAAPAADQPPAGPPGGAHQLEP